MTIFVEGLFDFLSDSGLSCGSRIYPSTLPQGVTLPAIVYSLVSNPPEMTQSGPSSLRYPKYQLDCYADGEDAYLDAARLADQVITVIDGYTGLMGSITVHAGFRDEMRDNHDPETSRYWVSVDVILWHTP